MLTVQVIVTKETTGTAVKQKLTIKPKHAKAYRKRHYVLLLTTLATAFLLVAVAVSLHIHILAGSADAQNFIAAQFVKATTTRQTVASSYGFSFQYDPRRLYASAIDGVTGNLYIGSELATQRPYQTIKLATNAVPHSATDPNTISIDYYPAEVAPSRRSLTDIEQSHLALSQHGAPPPLVNTTQSVTYNGITLQKTTWAQATSGQLSGQLEGHFISYTTIINGKPLIIRTNSRLGSTSVSADIDVIARSLSTAAPAISYQIPPAKVVTKLATNRSLLDTLLFSQASAAMDTVDSQAVSTLYAPAVVKIYNAYCTDISIRGVLYVTGACAASSGSGFFVSSDGYIATNGHVATANPKDLVIKNAYTAASGGNGGPLVTLAKAAGLNLNQLSTITDDKQLLDTIFNAVYNMPDSAFTKSNNVQNLLVGLDSKDPDVDKLLSVTSARRQFDGTDDIRAAKLVSADYRAFDGITRYRNSDVAIIKLAGNNYPVVKLGSLSEVSQGSPLSILGYPVAASDNTIVAKNVSEVTLTSGNVSAIKTANGDSRQLIETDTTIGHGNSGGPVFDDTGHVVGIATYTIDGAGLGDGTFNYIRDIADLQALASTSNLNFNTTSQTQLVWQKAIAAFDNAHYSKSLQLFSQVRELYPEHPTIDSFEARAEQNISDGKDVKDLPVGLLLAAAAGALLLAGVAITLIIRHHGKHQVYKLVNGLAAAEPVNPRQRPRGYYSPILPEPAAVPDVAAAHHLH